MPWSRRVLVRSLTNVSWSAYGLATSVGVSRIYLDKHWLSDLAGGLSIGLAYLLLAIWLIEVVFVRAPDPDRE